MWNYSEMKKNTNKIVLGGFCFLSFFKFFFEIQEEFWKADNHTVVRWYIYLLHSYQIFIFRIFEGNLSEENLFEKLQKKLPNLPLIYWQKNKRKFSGCNKIVNILDVKYNNQYWQVKETKYSTFFLYAAYFDIRDLDFYPFI